VVNVASWSVRKAPAAVAVNAPTWVEVPDQSRWSSGPGAGCAATL